MRKRFPTGSRSTLAVTLKNSPWGTARLALRFSDAQHMLENFLLDFSPMTDAENDPLVVDAAADKHRRA